MPGRDTLMLEMGFSFHQRFGKGYPFLNNGSNMVQKVTPPHGIIITGSSNTSFSCYQKQTCMLQIKSLLLTCTVAISTL